MSVETDKVLSAIRRGEDSLPKLRAATGLEYAKLHQVVHVLEFDWRSIRRTETADGFDRFEVTPSERSNGNHATVPITAMPLGVHNRTNASVDAHQITKRQRDAPYCVGCHGLCLIVVEADGAVKWRCRPCGSTFEGTTETEPVVMAHIDPEPEERVSIRRPRVELGPEEETILDEMRGSGLSEDEAQIAAEIDEELADEDGQDPTVETLIEEDLCPCGYAAKHRGRCRDGLSKSTRNSENARVPDLPTNCQTCGVLLDRSKRVNMNRCPTCWSAYLRDCNERRNGKPKSRDTVEACIECGKPRSLGSGQRCRSCYLGRGEAKRAQESGENITETITEAITKPDNGLQVEVASFASSMEGEKRAIPETLQDYFGQIVDDEDRDTANQAVKALADIALETKNPSLAAACRSTISLLLTEYAVSR